MIRSKAARRIYSRALALALALVSATHAQAPHEIGITLDPAITAIQWTLVTNTHTVHGTFKLKSGAMTLNPETGAASGLIVVDATSGESGDSARDSRMHKVILESAKFPTVTFRPVHVSGKFDPATTRSVTVDGIITLHGQEHPLQLTVALDPKASGPELTTHFILPYVEWGLKDASTFIFRAEKQVTLEIKGTATISP
jgi:polyisoprenoid-binding protein YceI